jgi:thioredoxin-related protein
MRIVFQISALMISSLIFCSFALDSESKEAIKWYSWDEAIALNETTNKKIFVDVYTDWCGWCKRMDATTFKDPKVIKYMNENFIAVKLDAEQKEDIIYKDYVMKFVLNGRRGYHELAFSLLDGRMSYPSYVYLAEDARRITISPGYKDASALLTELTFVSEDHFKTTTYTEFSKNFKP